MRLKRLGHIVMMQEGIMPKHLFCGYIVVVRRKGRPRNIGLHEVEQNMEKMGIRGWKRKARERNE